MPLIPMPVLPRLIGLFLRALFEKSSHHASINSRRLGERTIEQAKEHSSNSDKHLYTLRLSSYYVPTPILLYPP
jgi:hypothetical protein